MVITVPPRTDRARQKKRQQQPQHLLPVMPEMRTPEMSKSPRAPDEFSYDPLKMYLYKKAIRTGMERESSVRVNIIGNFSQGKTSLTRRLIGQNCDGVISTNGIEIRRFRCRKMKEGRLELVEDENKDFFGRIAAVARSFDTEKLSEKVERTATANTQNSHTVSATAEDHTFSLWQTQFPTTSQEPTDNRPVSLNVPKPVINTTQLPSISSEDYQTFSSGVDQEKDDVELSFDMWDFGGQYIFYATHTLFHSRKALYLLVVDLSSPLDKIVIDNEFPAESGEKNMEYFIKFWIESVHAFVGPGPPVILVGTHKDQIQGNEEAEQYFDQIRSIFEGTDMIDHIQPQDFAVDNHNFSDTEIPNLLQYLIQKGSELVQTVEIPARWMQLEKTLNQHRHKNVITFQDVMKIDADNEYPLKEEQQVKLFLQYHHEKGTLFYFDEEPMSEHVVLDPGFLIDAFKCIITPERFRLNDISIRPLWCSLKDEAKLTDELIKKVWSHNNEHFMKHKMVLLGYLKKHYIISQVVEYDMTSGTYKEQDWYIVPSLLKDKCLTEVMEDFLREKPRTMIRYFMQFEQTSIVQMLFHRLISAALGKWAILKFGNKHMLFKNLAVFKLEEGLAGIAELKYSGIELRVVSLCESAIGSQVPDRFRRFTEGVVTHEFRKLKSQMGENVKPFLQKYRCNHKIHTLNGSCNISDICLLLKKDSPFCPDNHTHKDISGREANAEWFQDERTAVAYSKQKLSDKHLSRLAQAIGKDWQLLGIELGIKQATIDHIEDENPRVAMRIFQMLLKWKLKAKNNATLDALVKSIRKCPSVTIEWDEFRNTNDEQTGILMNEHPVFIQPLEDLTVKANDKMVLECEQSKPDVKVKWIKDNEEIYDESRRRINVEKHIHRLIVEKVTQTDAGIYKCVFEDSYTACTVKVEAKIIPTEFLQKLEDKCIQDKSETVNFQCKINKENVDVKWYHENQVLSPSGKYQLVDEGPVHTLKIHNVVDTDEGTYLIVADGQRSSALLNIEDTEEEKKLLLQVAARKRESESEVSNLNPWLQQRPIYFQYKRARQQQIPNPSRIQTPSPMSIPALPVYPGQHYHTPPQHQQMVFNNTAAAAAAAAAGQPKYGVRPQKAVMSVKPDYTASAVQAAVGQPSPQPGYMQIIPRMMSQQPTEYQMGQPVRPVPGANPSSQRFMTPASVQRAQHSHTQHDKEIELRNLTQPNQQGPMPAHMLNASHFTNPTEHIIMSNPNTQQFQKNSQMKPSPSRGTTGHRHRYPAPSPVHTNPYQQSMIPGLHLPSLGSPRLLQGYPQNTLPANPPFQSSPHNQMTPQKMQQMHFQQYTSHRYPLPMQGSVGGHQLFVSQGSTMPTSVTSNMQAHTQQPPHIQPQIMPMPPSEWMNLHLRNSQFK